jgi:hypothetical protein
MSVALVLPTCAVAVLEKFFRAVWAFEEGQKAEKERFLSMEQITKNFHRP